MQHVDQNIGSIGQAYDILTHAAAVPLIADGRIRSLEPVAQAVQIRLNVGGTTGGHFQSVELRRRGDLRQDIAAKTMAESFFALTSSFVVYWAFLAGTSGRHSDDVLGLFWSSAKNKET